MAGDFSRPDGVGAAFSAQQRPQALLLWPGAGADRDHRALVAFDEALGDQIIVQRCDFPYRKAGRRAPGTDAAAITAIGEELQRACEAHGLDPRRVVLGGRSYGARMCSMAVAGGLSVGGLAMVSYPLHPPGKPDRLRVAHFGQLLVPCLFVSGERDPFGSPAEFSQHLGAIPGAVTMAWVGGAHDPKADAEVAGAIADWIGLG